MLLVPVVAGFMIGLAVLLTCRLPLFEVAAGFRIGLAVVLTCRLLLVPVVAGFRTGLAVVLLVVCFWFQSLMALGLVWLFVNLSFAFGSSRWWL